MRCPKCQYPNSKVVDSRPIEEGRGIRRRRVCPQCDYRFTSFERVEQPNFYVLKRDGSRELFQQEKLLQGFIKASAKRNISLAQLEQLTQAIAKDLQKKYTKEVPSEQIGQAALLALKNLDEVSYVRYLSVYLHFEKIEDFIAVLAEMKGR